MNTPIRHGELILLPTNKVEGTVKESGKSLILSHSETGHHHVLEAPTDIKVMYHDGNEYVEVPELSNLVHKKSGQHVHKTLEVQPGTYKIIKKRE